MVYQNLCDTAKTMLRGKFIAFNAYIIKEERFQINILNFHVKKPDQKKNLQNKQKEII